MNLEEWIEAYLRGAVREAYGMELDEVHVERPNDPTHGDYATNVALVNAKALKSNPLEIAQNVVESINEGDTGEAYRVIGEMGGRLPLFERIEVAGPGFINFWLSQETLDRELRELLAAGEGYGRRESSGEPVLLEYVSVNPTGPMTVAHGRHAAYGDSLAHILEAAGQPVFREYYFNDGGNQIQLLGESVAARYAELHGEEWPVADPDALYRGDYVREIARDFSEEHGDKYLSTEGLPAITSFATRWCMEDIKRTLSRVRSRFDAYFNEKSLYDSGEIERVIERLEYSGYAYESEGAIWLSASRFGDDKDRVLVKGDGSYTYMAPDLAYHLNKRGRGYETAVDVLGADHAGYPPRIRAGLAALGVPEEFLDVEMVRIVKLFREGEQVKVSKRAGTFVTLDELVDEVGVDVARYFYVRSSHTTEMNFDLDLAVQQSDENPVFYVQYAHARICSIFGRAGRRPGEVGDVPDGEFAFEERLLLMELLDFPRVVADAAARREVHPIPAYLETLAARYHQFYTVHRVLAEDEALRERRLALSAATRSVLASGLGLLGVEAPESM